MRIAITSLLIFALPAVLSAQDGKRVAVIIGNDNYLTRPLRNAVNDAHLMNRALQAAGFQTILRENTRKDDISDAIVEMVEKIGPDDTALFFYAGHGVQIEGENFLIPVDFETATSVVRAKSLFFSLSQAFDYLKRSRARRTIVILDACRTNPLSESQALQAGLAFPTNAGPETLVAFSTSPNHVASDNPNGKNSWFTEALADLIPKPGFTIEDILTTTTRRVMEATKEKQTPWRNSSLSARFYFTPPAEGLIETDGSVLEKWMDDARRREVSGEWAEATALLNQVLSRKPGGALEEGARARMPYVAAQRDAQAQFDAAQFAAAAKLYSQAVALDPFSVTAAFQGVNSYLLNDQLDEALGLLKTVRVRGSSAAVQKADTMLKELSPIHPASAEELRAGVRQPPPLAEVLATFRFGVVDVEAGKRYQQRYRVDLGSVAAELAPLYPPPPVPVPMAPTETAPVPDGLTSTAAADPLRLVISSADARDFFIRPNAPATVDTTPAARTSGQSEYGFVQFDGLTENISVVVNGKPATRGASGRMQLPVGKYLVQLVQSGKVLSHGDLEITTLATVAMPIRDAK